MVFIDKLVSIAYVVLAVMVVLCLAGGAVIFYFLKIKKKNRMSEDDVDYSGLKRLNSVDYIKFEDIVDDMVVTDHGTRFVGALRCRGFDFYSAQTEEQGATIGGFLSFTNLITKPMTYRQDCKAVDMDYSLERYQKAYEAVYAEAEELKRQMEEMRIALESPDISSEIRGLYETELESSSVQLEALGFRLFHLEHQIAWIDSHSGANAQPAITELWVFDWTFNEMDFSVELTKEEIYKRARQELRAAAQGYIHSLNSCGVKATRCTTEELIEINRRYSSPISAERYKLQDIVSSSYFDDIVSSTEPYETMLACEAVSIMESIEKEMLAEMEGK